MSSPGSSQKTRPYLTNPPLYHRVSLQPYLTALAIANRPESTVQLLPLLLDKLRNSTIKSLFTFAAVTFATYALTVAYDSYQYGVFIIPALNFLKYNLHKSSDHGTAPAWAIILHYLALYGPAGSYLLIKNAKSWSGEPTIFVKITLLTLLLHGLVGHKETRFLSPLTLFVCCDRSPSPRWVKFSQLMFTAVTLPVMMLHHRGEVLAREYGVDCLQDAYPVKGVRWLEGGEGWGGCRMVGTRMTPEEARRREVEWFWSLDLDDGVRTKLYVYEGQG